MFQIRPSNGLLCITNRLNDNAVVFVNMALRDEWFDGGISDLLRKDLGIESTQKMAKAVQPHIFPNNQSSDEVLKNLVEKEYSRYLELTEGNELNFFQRTQKIVNTYPLDFPETKTDQPELAQRTQSLHASRVLHGRCAVIKQNLPHVRAFSRENFRAFERRNRAIPSSAMLSSAVLVATTTHGQLLKSIRYQVAC